MSNALLKHPYADKPALRLVKTNDLSREDWLEVRKTGIGSSDAAAAVGLNPYKSALELWLEKTGKDGNLPAIDPMDDSHPTFWGSLLEPTVAAVYTKRTGNRVRKVNAVLQHPDQSLSFMLANIDRLVTGDPQVSILECKTAGMNGARLWKEGVPEYVQLQVQHQLAVTGKQAADVAVLVCGQELQIHRVHRDAKLIETLIELEQRFWAYVTSNTPPPPDGSDSAAKALQALYPYDNTERLDFSGNDAMNTIFARLLDVRIQLGTLSGEEALLKQSIQAELGNATHAVFEGGEVSWKRTKDSVGLDTATLLRDQPDLKDRYSIVKPGSRRFLIA